MSLIMIETIRLYYYLDKLIENIAQ